ncbi:RNA polymerase factor sigma-54 [Lysobacter sp. GX 14042]|uniref:RNA polymerase factor sigma-54 n=1 Tax=Lysobacter sp. GX 14042 TaxID=2907155 RepID=UPI001F261C8E|nr:RNA polymerase factor sigma-54 [Lysobacter sp. GX 14042]
MKTSVRAQLSQGLNLTPQLLQSIRLLQLTAPQLEQELRQALDRNPLLEHDEDDEAGETGIEAQAAELDTAALEAAAFDELPDPAFTSGTGAGIGGDDDGMARIAAGSSTDPRVRLLQELAMEWDGGDLLLAQWWLDHCDDRGYLEQPVDRLARDGAEALAVDPAALLHVRQRLLAGPWPGMAAADAGECLRAQLARLPLTGDPDPAGRLLADRILAGHLDLLAAHDHAALAQALGADPADIARACGLILALRPQPVEDAPDAPDGVVIPDVVVRHLDGGWRVALNTRGAPRVRVSAHCEAALGGGSGHAALRGLLEEARWLVRGIAMRDDTLLRTAKVLVERQAGFLARGDEALVPLTLREVADEIGMHESTVSRITTGKYIQTPRGTFELKRLFAVRLEGAEVSGAAVKAMVKRLIDDEPSHAPLADDTIAALLARRGIRIARRTVAKYRDQLNIGPARSRRRPAQPLRATA